MRKIKMDLSYIVSRKEMQAPYVTNATSDLECSA